MEALETWFRQHLSAAFLAYQAGLFSIVIGFLWAVRRTTGRTIHLGKDPSTVTESGTALRGPRAS
jgi:hypothetical protein